MQKRISIRLPENLYSYLERRSLEDGLSLSDILRKIIDDYSKNEPVLERIDARLKEIEERVRIL